MKHQKQVACIHCGTDMTFLQRCPVCPTIVDKMMEELREKAEIILQSESGTVELHYSLVKGDVKIHINSRFN